ncbi:MAG: hypothetical protein EAS52_19650, partial [Parapedobacter sp.]
MKTAIRAGLFCSLLRSEKSPERRIKEAARTPLFFGFIDNILSFLGFSGHAMRMSDANIGNDFKIHTYMCNFLLVVLATSL